MTKKKDRGKTRLLMAVLLALAMTIVFIPAMVFADDEGGYAVKVEMTNAEEGHYLGHGLPGDELGFKATLINEDNGEEESLKNASYKWTLSFNEEEIDEEWEDEENYIF